MTATDELRALLDERGVKHFDHEEGEPLRDLSEAGPDPATSWLIGNASVCAVPIEGSYLFDLWIDHVTTAQAIDATLGRGTCRFEERHGDWYCTGCGEMVGTCDTASELYIDGNAVGCWNFCPNCGREVVQS